MVSQMEGKVYNIYNDCGHCRASKQTNMFQHKTHCIVRHWSLVSCGNECLRLPMNVYNPLEISGSP